MATGLKLCEWRVCVEPAPAGLENAYADIFTDDAQLFVAELYKAFADKTKELYQRRIQRKLELDSNNSTPDFLKETKTIRDDTKWRIASVPARVQCRKIDCGDVSPSNLEKFKRALNSQANGIQVDFDDGHCPSWKNQILGYYNIVSAAFSRLTDAPAIDKAPVLMLRPRAWNMVEHNMTVSGEKVPGPLVDFGLLMFHCSKRLYDAGSGPFFYLSKLEGYMEARLWKEIFCWTETKLQLPHGTIKACVLIENILASFEMEEILYELQDHSLGLNCGIWDYCASIINKFGTRPEFRLPDRSKYVNMQKHFLSSYCKKVICVSHRRGAPATGGMNAKLLPVDDLKQRDEITRQVCSSKRLEVEMGVDGFLIYDLDLIPAALKMVDELIPGNNQLDKMPVDGDLNITASDLLTLPEGSVTRQGLVSNISVGILFIKSWLQGSGVFIHNGAVEDSATAEISRSQVWQWLRHGAVVEEDGSVVSKELVISLIREVLPHLRQAETEREELLVTASQVQLTTLLSK